MYRVRTNSCNTVSEYSLVWVITLTGARPPGTTDMWGWSEGWPSSCKAMGMRPWYFLNSSSVWNASVRCCCDNGPVATPDEMAIDCSKDCRWISSMLSMVCPFNRSCMEERWMRNAICDVPCSVYIMEEECCQWSGCGKYTTCVNC